MYSDSRKDIKGTLDLGLSLMCAYAHSSMRVGRGDLLAGGLKWGPWMLVTMPASAAAPGSIQGGPMRYQIAGQHKGEDLEQLDYGQYIDKTVCHSKTAVTTIQLPST